MPVFAANGSLREDLTITPAGNLTNGGSFPICSRSPSGIGADTYQCGPTVTDAPACAGHPGSHDVYCIDDPIGLHVRHFTVDPALTSVPAPTTPTPFLITLANGSTCTLRTGGSWTGRPDGWTGAYYCSDSPDVVLEKNHHPAIDTTSATWVVMTGTLPGAQATTAAAPTPVNVVSAYFVTNTAGASQFVTSDSSARFQSPSGNIRCEFAGPVSDGESGVRAGYLSCELVVADGIGPAGCAGGSIQITAQQNHTAVELCRGGADMPVSPVLGYGQTVSMWGYSCTSTANHGIECVQPGGHTTQVSRDLIATR